MNRSNLSRNEMLKIRLGQLAKTYDTGKGRTLEELKKSTDVLKGQESLRLRQFCTTECMMPLRDLDDYGQALMMGFEGFVRSEYDTRLRLLSATMEDDQAAKDELNRQYYALRWGPTEVPLFNLLGLFMLLMPSKKEAYLKTAKFYIDMGVPVDGKDLSGTTALSHCFSTKPSVELEYAQMLYDAGGDVNTRNRYGATVAHEIVQVYDPSDPVVVGKARRCLEWFLSHGGSLDIADGDGVTPRFMCGKFTRSIPAFKTLADDEDQKRKAKGDSCCSLCGRDGGPLLTCSRCKKAKYCSPQSRACQKLDWPKHKKECKACHQFKSHDSYLIALLRTLRLGLD